MIVSTHRAEVADLSDRCIALHDGGLVYDGPADRSVIAGHLPPPDDALPAVDQP